MTLPVIERENNKHRKIFLVAIFILVLIILANYYNIFAENLTLIFLGILIVCFLILMFSINNFKKIGYIVFTEDTIAFHNTQDKINHEFEIQSINRIRLIYTGIKGQLVKGRLLIGQVYVKGGVNKIEIITQENALIQYEILIDTESLLNHIERAFYLIDQKHKNKVELLKEMKQ